MLRGWTSIPQAVSKVWRIRGRIPTLNRFLWCGPHLFRRDTPLVANPKQPRVAKGEPLPYHRELKLTHDSQILDVLEEKLKQSSGELTSSPSMLSPIVGHIRDNCATYSTDIIIELLRILYDYEVKDKDILVPLGEELASRISNMPLRFQYTALYTLLKLNLDHLVEACGSLDSNSLVNALKLESKSATKITKQSFKGTSWSTELAESLQHYVVTNSLKFNLEDIRQILSVLIEKKIATSEVLRALAKAVSSILMLDIPVEDRWFVWGPYYPLKLNYLVWAFGKMKFYNEELFAAFASLTQGKPDILLQTPNFYTRLSWCCAKARFYSEPVMHSIAEYSLRHLNKFTNQDIALLVYSFAVLNYRHHDLVNSAIDKILSHPSHITDHRICWMIAWGAMVLEQYPVKLLSQMLNDDYMKDSLGLPEFRYIALLQFCIALNFEQPQLGLGIKFKPSLFRKWGTGLVSAGNITESMMQLAMKDRILVYEYTSTSSPFNQYVASALKAVVGGSHYYNTEALSIAGYNLDFEILFDADHRPILIPSEWKHRRRELLFSSVGLGRVKRKKSPAKLLKETESGSMVDVDPVPREKLISLASDWGQKLALPGTPVSKKIALEADGPWHFAANCNHVLGHTILKRRQLKALGWEVISIPYMEWDDLERGNEQVEYLLKKFNLHTTYS